MTVEELRLFLNYVANKEQSGNSLSPLEYNTLLSTSVTDFFNKQYGLYQEYQVNSPTPRVAWEVAQYVTDALKHLKVYEPTMAVDAEGKITLPDDYYHHSSLRYSYEKTGVCINDPAITVTQGIKILKDSELEWVLSSSLKKPAYNKAYGVYYNGYIKLFPIDAAATVQYTYLKKPATPVWAYTMVSGQPAYDSASSVQIDFPDFCHKDIGMIILSYMGINLSRENLVAYAENLKIKGV